jgi:hypothetical protein
MAVKDTAVNCEVLRRPPYVGVGRIELWGKVIKVIKVIKMIKFL